MSAPGLDILTVNSLNKAGFRILESVLAGLQKAGPEGPETYAYVD